MRIEHVYGKGAISNDNIIIIIIMHGIHRQNNKSPLFY